MQNWTLAVALMSAGFCLGLGAISPAHAADITSVFWDKCVSTDADEDAVVASLQSDGWEEHKQNTTPGKRSFDKEFEGELYEVSISAESFGNGYDLYCGVITRSPGVGLDANLADLDRRLGVETFHFKLEAEEPRIFLSYTQYPNGVRAAGSMAITRRTPAPQAAQVTYRVVGGGTQNGATQLMLSRTIFTRPKLMSPGG